VQSTSVDCIVPGKAPAVTAGAYETVTHGADGLKQIKLYWQVMLRNVHFTISYFSDVYYAVSSLSVVSN